MYDASLHDHGQLQPSYWEATAARPASLAQVPEGDEVCEVAIIGGGYTGLSTAWHLAARWGIEATVIEAGPIGWGASGRNGGFVCIPSSKLTLRQMRERHGDAETRRFFDEMVEGTRLPAAIALEEGFDIGRAGEGNLQVCHHPARWAALTEWARGLVHYGVPVTVLDAAAFRERAHGGSEQHGGLHLAVGHALHPLAFCVGLATAALRRGARLRPSTRVTAWRREGGVHCLVTDRGVVRARRVVLATNGWTPDGLHRAYDARVLPAISSIIVTRPLSDAERAAESWHTLTPVVNARRLLFYYRMLPDGRFLFGSRGDVTGTPEAGMRIGDWMIGRMRTLWPSWSAVDIEYRWRGLVCLTRNLTPAIGRLAEDPTVLHAFGCHGNGVNLGTFAGARIAEAIARDAAPDVGAVMRGLPPRFPFPGARELAIRGAYAWYRLRDWWQDQGRAASER